MLCPEGDCSFDTKQISLGLFGKCSFSPGRVGEEGCRKGDTMDLCLE